MKKTRGMAEANSPSSSKKKPESKQQAATVSGAKLQRLESGIPGLDELIEGGIPCGTVVLLSGHSGTGRSTLAMQFLQQGVKNGETSVYVSLEREVEEVLEAFSDFDWDLESMMKEKKLSIVKPDMRRFDTLRQTIEDEVDRLSAKRLVIDPFSLLTAYFNNVYDVRKALSDLSRQMRAAGCTLLAVTDIKENDPTYSSTGFEEFVAGGIINLGLIYKEKSNELVRTLLVRKMSRTKHALKPIPFDITENGAVIYPDAEVFE